MHRIFRAASRVAAIVAVLALASCSSMQVVEAPRSNLLRVNPNVRVNVHGDDIDQQTLDDLTRYLKGDLVIAGFHLAAKGSKAIRVDVDVKEYSPGNQALRIIVGAGAGRGSLIYVARYVDDQGKVLAKLDGKERFTGMEVSYNQHYGGATTLGGAARVRSVLVQEACKHIVALGLGELKPK